MFKRKRSIPQSNVGKYSSSLNLSLTLQNTHTHTTLGCDSLQAKQVKQSESHVENGETEAKLHKKKKTQTKLKAANYWPQANHPLAKTLLTKLCKPPTGRKKI